MTVPVIEVNRIESSRCCEEEESKEVIISCENIQKTYLLGIEGVAALRGVSLNIFRGEFVAIYGISGGGKTSLLNILGSIDVPTKGHLTINGMKIFSHRTTDLDMACLRLKDIGFVFQTFNLLPTLTASENVELPMILLGAKTKRERMERVNTLLENVGMHHRSEHYPSMLSGGEQQRVTIARALANAPSILLLDEPTGDLDTYNTNLIMELLLRLNEQQGITCVMVTHDSNLKKYANRAVYISDGKLQRIESINVDVRIAKIAALRSKLATSSTLRANTQDAGIPSTNESLSSASNTPPVCAQCANTATSMPQQLVSGEMHCRTATGRKVAASVGFTLQEPQQITSPSPLNVASPTPSQLSSSYGHPNFSTVGSSGGGSSSSSSSNSSSSSSSSSCSAGTRSPHILTSSRTEHRTPQYYAACISTTTSSHQHPTNSNRFGSEVNQSSQLLQQLFGNRLGSGSAPATTSAGGTGLAALKGTLLRMFNFGHYYVEKHSVSMNRQPDTYGGTAQLLQPREGVVGVEDPSAEVSANLEPTIGTGSLSAAGGAIKEKQDAVVVAVNDSES